MAAYEKLVERFQQIYQLDHAMSYLGWDQAVMMPQGGNEARSASIAEIATIRHGKLTEPCVGGWLEEVQSDDTAVASSVREMRRMWQQEVCLPADLVKAKILAGSRCEHGWRTQRGQNDWQGFLENFQPVVALCREEAVMRQEACGFATPYDALLDLHCAGDGRDLIDGVFSVLRETLPELLQTVLEKQKSQGRRSVRKDYSEQAQFNLCQSLMTDLGFEFECGRLDKSAHPFSMGVCGDLRITTRFSDNVYDALSATAHEVGHALYEAGLPEALRGLPVGSHRNMCIHESQSLLFEKQLFLSKAFTRYFSATVSAQLPDFPLSDGDTLWRANMRISPGFIRVDADEICYPLHVLLRYEIESDLINSRIEAQHIPDLWDEKMTAYLGVSTTGNYRDGCLQDIHWTDGAFGYFPSYTIGAVNAAQLFAALRRQHPDWQERLLKGETGFIRDWLDAHVWSQGSQLESQELMRSATGAPTDPHAYVQHLKARYLDELY